MGRENKTGRCVEWECRAKQGDVLSGKGGQTERCVEWEGRAKQRDVLIGKVKQIREIL